VAPAFHIGNLSADIREGRHDIIIIVMTSLRFMSLHPLRRLQLPAAMDSDSIAWDPGEKLEMDAKIPPYALPMPLQQARLYPEKVYDDDALPADPEKEDSSHFSQRPRQKHNTTSSLSSTKYAKSHLPPPLSFDPWTKKASIAIAILGLLFFDLILPCLIYYLLETLTDLDEADVLGIACASLGLGELLELPLRGYHLVRNRESYAPLGQTAKWGFDFFFWWYAIATIVGIVPYVMATDLDYAIEWLFLMSPGLIVGFAVLTAGVSAVPFRLPVRVSSDAKGEKCKPFVYYVIEDFVAVDAHQKRAFREELRVRYEASKGFRIMIWEVNMWWVSGGVLFIGVLAGITWGMSFPVAYGVSLGWLFVWMGVWSWVTFWWVKRALRMEREWFLQSAASADPKSMMV
jgi:hypothetical protein